MLEGYLNIVSVHLKIYIIDDKVPSSSLNLFHVISFFKYFFYKEIEFLPQTQIFWSQYFCNLVVQTLDISNLDYFIFKYLNDKLGYKDIEIRKSEFVAKTQLLLEIFIFWSVSSLSSVSAFHKNHLNHVLFIRLILDPFARGFNGSVYIPESCDFRSQFGPLNIIC